MGDDVVITEGEVPKVGGWWLAAEIKKCER